jgi:hypothetical protein
MLSDTELVVEWQSFESDLQRQFWAAKRAVDGSKYCRTVEQANALQNTSNRIYP